MRIAKEGPTTYVGRSLELLGRRHVLEAVHQHVGVRVAPGQRAELEPRDVERDVADLEGWWGMVGVQGLGFVGTVWIKAINIK